MNIEELRDYFLSLPEATEKIPFEGFVSYLMYEDNAKECVLFIV